jgi:hypothetical protein
MSRFNEQGFEYFGADDTRDFLFAVNAGYVKGHRQVRTFGFNPDLDNGAAEYVCDLGYEPKYDTVNTQLYAMSTSASDNLLIKVYGLKEDVNGNWNETSCVVMLNGTNPVALSETFIRILRTENNNGTSLQGVVYISKSQSLPITDADINLRAKINIGEETTHMAMFTVPSGYTAFIYRLYQGVRKNEDAVFNYQMRSFGKVFKSIGKASSYQSSEQLIIGYERVYEKSDIRVKCIASTNNTEASASFHMLLVENECIKLGELNGQ